jgi:hypothetical protein
MSKEPILPLLYEMVEDMTKANDFNYDWVVHKGGDKFRGVKGQVPAVTISSGDEDNVDDRGGIGSGQYIDEATYFITAKVGIKGADILPSDVKYEEEQAIARAIDDIKTRYDSEAFFCGKGVEVKSLQYQGSISLEKANEQKYTTMRIQCRFDIKYVTERKLFDK